MAITQTQILELCISMFNAAPGATYLAEIEAMNASTTTELAEMLGQTDIFNAQFEGMDDAAVANVILGNFNIDPTSAAGVEALAWVTANQATMTTAQIMAEAHAYLSGDAVAPAFADAAAVLTNKTAVALDYSVTKALSATDLAALKATVSTVDATEASVTAAIAANTVADTTLLDAAAAAQYAFNTETETAGSAAELALELAAATAVEAALASGVTQTEINDAVTALTAANFTTLRATYVANLDAANDAVTAQETVIADSLEAAFANEDVLAEVTDQVGSATTAVEADDVIEADIGQAELTTATVFNATVAAASAADFIALTDAQQDGQIALGVLDLQAAIDAADAVINNATTGTILALETGVAVLMATAETSATALATATDALDATEAVTAVEEIVASTGGLQTLVTITSADFSYDAATQTVLVTDNLANTLDITTVTSNVLSVATTGVALNTTTNVYTFTTAGGTVAISAGYITDLITAAQAELNAVLAVTAAETALNTAVVNVLEAQDSTFDGTLVDYASLVTDGAVTVTNVTDASVALDYSVATDNADADSTATGGGDALAVGGAALDTYAASLVSLTTENTALTDFNAAVAAWEAVDVIVDQLAADNATLTTLETAATEASALITNAVDHATVPGLAINLITVAAAAEAATAASDLFMATAVDTAISDFGLAGSDSIYVGSDFTLVTADATATIADSLGVATLLEAIVIDDGTDTTIYFEEIASAGNGTTAADNNVIELTGVTGLTASIDADGFLTMA